MKRLSRALSRAGEAKEKEAMEAAVRPVGDSPSPPPPAYHESVNDIDDDLRPSDVTAGFSNLHIGNSTGDEPKPQECIAHLKLLECFYRLKQKIATSEGLFGISMDIANQLNEIEKDVIPEIEDKSNELQALLAEKRWQVYLARAVYRFSVWRNSIEPDYKYYTLGAANSFKGETLGDQVNPKNANPISFYPENLPPVDVLMVWHAYMLNPRAYLEDCLREGRMRLWHTSMPWQAVVDAINSESFEYEPSKTAALKFERDTRLNWDNVNDSEDVSFECPHCYVINKMAWTTCRDITNAAWERQYEFKTVGAAVIEAVRTQLSTADGYADKGFLAFCYQCNSQITHDTLCAGKFRKDLKLAITEDVLMPGNILGKDGIPGRVGKVRDASGYAIFAFPTKLVKAGLGRQILRFNKDVDLRMSTIRENIEEGMADKELVKTARLSYAYRLLKDEAIAVRRMMSRYWDNSSPFALDLVGAVTRQADFIEKMHNIDWLHSPALPNTMSRLILKYVRFMGIISRHRQMAVPTLDVDLAWHTHQLNPSAYLQYTVAESKTFIDHDDKVAEAKLTDSFAWTSKTYQKIYGEPYSECTCWYCEAVRESHTSTASRLFRSSTATAAEELHDVPSDPKKSVHISSHNAVRPEGDPSYDMACQKRTAELEKAYEKACHRADKKGRKRPKRDDYYYSDAYGFPVYMPAYAPFVGAMAFTPVIYPVNPGCMALGAGAVGNCCAGTCGATVAAGSCGGSGACGGGMGMAMMASGTCGGGGFGSCGGGGGGGCGGGGGGGGGCGGGGGGC